MIEWKQLISLDSLTSLGFYYLIGILIIILEWIIVKILQRLNILKKTNSKNNKDESKGYDKRGATPIPLLGQEIHKVTPQNPDPSPEFRKARQFHKSVIKRLTTKCKQNLILLDVSSNCLTKEPF